MNLRFTSAWPAELARDAEHALEKFRPREPAPADRARSLELDFRAVWCRRFARKRASGLPRGGGLSAIATQGLAPGTVVAWAGYCPERPCSDFD